MTPVREFFKGNDDSDADLEGEGQTSTESGSEVSCRVDCLAAIDDGDCACDDLYDDSAEIFLMGCAYQ